MKSFLAHFHWQMVLLDVLRKRLLHSTQPPSLVVLTTATKLCISLHLRQGEVLRPTSPALDNSVAQQLTDFLSQRVPRRWRFHQPPHLVPFLILLRPFSQLKTLHHLRQYSSEANRCFLRSMKPGFSYQILQETVEESCFCASVWQGTSTHDSLIGLKCESSRDP